MVDSSKDSNKSNQEQEAKWVALVVGGVSCAVLLCMVLMAVVWKTIYNKQSNFGKGMMVGGLLF